MSNTAGDYTLAGELCLCCFITEYSLRIAGELIRLVVNVRCWELQNNNTQVHDAPTERFFLQKADHTNIGLSTGTAQKLKSCLA